MTIMGGKPTTDSDEEIEVKGEEEIQSSGDTRKPGTTQSSGDTRKPSTVQSSGDTR
jgi:hypothetical protein